MLSIYLVYFILGALGKLFILATSIFVAVAILAAMWKLGIVLEAETIPKPDTDGYESWVKSTRLWWRGAIPALILGCLLLITPKQDEAVTILALYHADKYLEEHPDSSLNPRKIVGTFDKAAGELENFMVTLPKLLTRATNVADKGLEKIEKKAE